ncbi:MAG: PopZ family protein, partial [Beijerinckiaceae bacterium]
VQDEVPAGITPVPEAERTLQVEAVLQPPLTHAEQEEEIFDLAQQVEAEDDFAFRTRPPMAAAPAAAEIHVHESGQHLETTVPATEALVSPGTDAAVAASFQSLAQTIMLNNTTMIEQMTREMLRPMLKTWLDDNLPVMVERLVRTEIERVARGGR